MKNRENMDVRLAVAVINQRPLAASDEIEAGAGFAASENAVI
jgi:hypothetical protein